MSFSQYCDKNCKRQTSGGFGALALNGTATMWNVAAGISDESGSSFSVVGQSVYVWQSGLILNLHDGNTTGNIPSFLPRVHLIDVVDNNKIIVGLFYRMQANWYAVVGFSG
jgi:hypothetical protein